MKVRNPILPVVVLTRRELWCWPLFVPTIVVGLLTVGLYVWDYFKLVDFK